MKKLLVATTLAALTITTPTTVSAKPNNVRYSTGIVTGAKSITIPISDIALVYTDSLGYTTLQLKDYGCVADDPNNISYETIKQMVNSYYASVREATDSVTVTEPNGNTWIIRK